MLSARIFDFRSIFQTNSGAGYKGLKSLNCKDNYDIYIWETTFIYKKQHFIRNNIFEDIFI